MFVIATSSGDWMGFADPRALFTSRRVRSSHDGVQRHHSLLPTALCLLEAFLLVNRMYDEDTKRTRALFFMLFGSFWANG